jgi:DNA-binding IclR family transcriptional regulator
MNAPDSPRRTGTASRKGLQIVARAARVLRLLERSAQGLSLDQIAAQCGYQRDSVERIVDALSSEQLVIAPTANSGVLLGPGLARMGASVRSRQHQLTHTMLVELSGHVGESLDLCRIRGTCAVVTDHVSAPQQRRVRGVPGRRLPLHCTAAGKALLAAIGQSEREWLLTVPYVKYTPATLTDIRHIEEQIDSCRRSGLAYDHEEFVPGHCGIATAFVDPLGIPVAMYILAPLRIFRHKAAQFAEQLLATRTRLIAEL